MKLVTAVFPIKESICDLFWVRWACGCLRWQKWWGQRWYDSLIVYTLALWFALSPFHQLSNHLPSQRFPNTKCQLYVLEIAPASVVSKIYFFPALPSLARFSALSGLFWSFICTLSLKIGKKRAIFRKYSKEPKVVYFPLYELYSILATLVCFWVMLTCTSAKTFKPSNSISSY